MKSKSNYHSPLRQAQTAATRTRILEACASVMVTGAELTYSKVAQAAGVEERTIYRHFPTKADLEVGLWGWIIENLTHTDFSARTEDALIVAMRTSFLGFDAGATLIQAMLHSAQGLQIRSQQQAARRVMFEAIIADAIPNAPPEVRIRAAATLQILYSAASWEFLRSFWEMDAAQAADAVELAIRAMLAGLRAGAGQQAGLPDPPVHDEGGQTPRTVLKGHGKMEDGEGEDHE